MMKKTTTAEFVTCIKRSVLAQTHLTEALKSQRSRKARASECPQQLRGQSKIIQALETLGNKKGDGWRRRIGRLREGELAQCPAVRPAARRRLERTNLKFL